jgi:hypothetical protein
MVAIRNKKTEYINEIPEEKHPLEISSMEELYNRMDEGLDDVANGRGKPLAEAMKDIRKELAQYGV